MPVKSAQSLTALTIKILEAAGVNPAIAKRTADHLIGSNLAGLDSHGIMRLSDYVDQVHKGKVAREDLIEVIRDHEAMALLDGHYTFGQMTAFRATEMAVTKAHKFGIGIVSARNSSHIGRLGEYAEQMTRQNMAGFICINLQGGGQVVAPWGGSKGRIGTNAQAWGVPTGGEPMIIDFSTAASAEGKIRVKFRRGETLPANWIINSHGEPSRDAADLYGPPMGAILTAGEHKGYGLSLITEALTGALNEGGVSCPETNDYDYAANAFTVIAIEIALFTTLDQFTGLTDRLIAHVKTSPPRDPDGEVLVPYEPESRQRRKRSLEGIPVEDITWQRIVATANSLGVEIES